MDDFCSDWGRNLPLSTGWDYWGLILRHILILVVKGVFFFGKGEILIGWDVNGFEMLVCVGKVLLMIYLGTSLPTSIKRQCHVSLS